MGNKKFRGILFYKRNRGGLDLVRILLEINRNSESFPIENNLDVSLIKNVERRLPITFEL